jgi:hypothetical protein
MLFLTVWLGFFFCLFKKNKQGAKTLLLLEKKNINLISNIKLQTIKA